MNQLKGFHGKWFPLSNIAETNFTYKNVKFKSVEHALQASKTESIFYFNCVVNAKTAWEAKRLGRLVPIRNDWGRMRPIFLENFVKAKFEQNPLLVGLLLETDTMDLIYENTWNDTFSGISYGQGENNLGKLLMKMRETYKEEESIFYDQVANESTQQNLYCLFRRS